jgi:hypothetical protein
VKIQPQWVVTLGKQTTKIYLLRSGFHPVAIVGYTYIKIGKRQLYTKGETIHKTTQKHRIHKIENKRRKQENKHDKNIKRHKSSN